MRIALATCRKKPEPDPDEAPLLAELRRLGADARTLAWDGPAADAAGFDLCVLRSTWNYIHRLPDFLAWAGRASRRTRLRNPARVVRWNSDKRYLRALAGAGVPTVPTAFYPRGGRRPLRSILAERGWREFVIKPQIGAASFQTRRFSASRLGAAEDFLYENARSRAMMIQPYLSSVRTRGERSIIWIDGRLTHAVRKKPRLADGHGTVTTPVRMGDDERRFARRVLESRKEPLLYARVDLVRDDAGDLRLMELELIEPSLFLRHEARALRFFAERCVAAARSAR